MFEYFKDAYDRFWSFFKNSGTILLARLTYFVSFIIAALAAMDWSTLVGTVNDVTGFTRNQLFWTFGLVGVKGIFDEIVRRSNTKEVDNVLVSKSTETVATKAVKKPGKLKKVK